MNTSFVMVIRLQDMKAVIRKVEDTGTPEIMHVIVEEEDIGEGLSNYLSICVRLLSPEVAVRRAVAMKVPPGQSDIDPTLNTHHTVIAPRQNGASYSFRIPQRSLTEGRVWSSS
jgi:hypothetical protein